VTDKPTDYHEGTGGDEYNRAEFDAFARSLGAVIRPLPDDQATSPKANGNGTTGGKGPLSPEYRRMVRDAKAYFGSDIKAALTAMLAPYRVTDTHDLTPAQCAEISEKIEILRGLTIRACGAHGVREGMKQEAPPG
jgi:hypothetical protein